MILWFSEVCHEYNDPHLLFHAILLRLNSTESLSLKALDILGTSIYKRVGKHWDFLMTTSESYLWCVLCPASIFAFTASVKPGWCMYLIILR